MEKKTWYNYFKGKAVYTQTKRPNQYGAYSICLQFEDDNEIDKFKKSGIQVELSDDNKAWFRREDSKLIKNELVKQGPPEVLDKDKNIITDLVGTNSDVIIKVRSYNTMKGIGHTLDKIKVINLIPVETSSEFHDF